jgi:hypothetical protein
VPGKRFAETASGYFSDGLRGRRFLIIPAKARKASLASLEVPNVAARRADNPNCFPAIREHDGQQPLVGRDHQQDEPFFMVRVSRIANDPSQSVTENTRSLFE